MMSDNEFDVYNYDDVKELDQMMAVHHQNTKMKMMMKPEIIQDKNSIKIEMSIIS